jgi:hypothetical protein
VTTYRETQYNARRRYGGAPVSTPEQEGLFDIPLELPPGLPLNRLRPAPRAQFLAGLLAGWQLGERKPSRAARAELERLAVRTLQLAEVAANIPDPARPK